MIAFLSGKIVLDKGAFVILETGGVGYKVNSPNFIGKEGETAKVFIHHHIREEAEDLYGFGTYEELELFERLISVNGVGPRVAMAIMAGQQESKISAAILTDNVSFFQAIPGIGKKVAAKIILDLKTKISSVGSGNILANMGKADEVVEALESLGYKNTEIMKLVPQIPSNCQSSEDKIKWLIKNIKR